MEKKKNDTTMTVVAVVLVGIAVGFLWNSNNHFNIYDSMDLIFVLFSLAFAVFNVILLIKIWQMTNDVRELKTFFVDGKKPKKEEEEQPVEVPESLVKAVERQIPKDQAERKDLFMGTTV